MNKEPIFSKFGKTAAETHQILQKVYGDKCLSHPSIYEWFERFKEGREDLNDYERSGRPRSAANEENVETVREFIKKRAVIFVPKGQTVSAVFYLDVTKRLMARIYRVRTEYREKGSWRSLHDNAPAHRLMLISDFFTKNSISTVNHSPYSHYLAP